MLNSVNVSLKERGIGAGSKWIEFFFTKQQFLVRALTIPFPRWVHTVPLQRTTRHHE